MHATICKFSLQIFTLAAKAQQKNVVGEVDMPERREAQRIFWRVWCVWHRSNCSWTLSPAAAVSCLCQPLPPPSPPPPPPRMTDFAWCWGEPNRCQTCKLESQHVKLGFSQRTLTFGQRTAVRAGFWPALRLRAAGCCAPPRRTRLPPGSVRVLESTAQAWASGGIR